jgi:hypothetical protein
MAARPNTLRTLEYGVRIAVNHTTRLNDMVSMAERALQDNQLLTPEDISVYKQSIRIAKKQLTLCAKLAELAIPTGSTSSKRKTRGRPSKAELESLATARGEKVAKAKPAAPKPRKPRAQAKAAPVVEAAPKKKRGRPSKADIAARETLAAAEQAPKKKRGRPSKADIAAREILAAAEQAPKKRRTRKATAAPVTADAPKRKPGRPRKNTNSVATASA